MSYDGKFSWQKGFFSSVAEVTISTPMDMIFCYSIIYYLLPKFLYKGRYVQMALLWILFSVVFIVTFRAYNYYVLPSIRRSFGMPLPHYSTNLPWLFLDLFYQINMEGCMAAAIKLGKMAFIKQQEVDLIKKEKLKVEPDLLQGKMQPVFLLNALDRVEQLSVSRPALIPGMVKKIKNLLLYVIYDNNQASVDLNKELKVVEEYVELEKTGMADNLRAVIKITGNIAGERIAPFIILPLVENSFRQLSLLELPNKSIDLEIRLAEGQLYIIVAWSKPVDTSTLGNGGNVFLNNIGKRLSLLYPQSHELKVTIKTNQFIIHCRINLHGAVN